MQVATELCSLLEANNFKDFDFLVIEEEHYSNANFIVAGLMWHCIVKEKGRVILVRFHHSLQHYQHLLNKFGINPQIFNDKSKFVNIDALNFDYSNSTDLISVVQKHCEELSDVKTYLVIDNIGYIVLLSSLKICVNFSRYFPTLLNQFSRLKLVVCNHVSPLDEELRIVSTFCHYLDAFVVNTTPLKSGFSNDVTGHLRITRTKKYTTKTNKYSYKIEDNKLTIAPRSN